MQLIDWWDLVQHGAPWVLFIRAVVVKFTQSGAGQERSKT
jgi:hypothetical protein